MSLCESKMSECESVIINVFVSVVIVRQSGLFDQVIMVEGKYESLCVIKEMIESERG